MNPHLLNKFGKTTETVIYIQEVPDFSDKQVTISIPKVVISITIHYINEKIMYYKIGEFKTSCYALYFMV